jgi:hypothetical protein
VPLAGQVGQHQRRATGRVVEPGHADTGSVNDAAALDRLVARLGESFDDVCRAAVGLRRDLVARDYVPILGRVGPLDDDPFDVRAAQVEAEVAAGRRQPSDVARV